MIEISENIRKIKNGNVFLENNYKNYVNATNDKFYVVSDSKFYMPIRVGDNKIATLLSEPLPIEENPYSYQTFINESCKSIIEEFNPTLIKCLSSARFKCYPELTGVKLIPFGTYTIDLTKKLEDIKKQMARSYRNQISRACRDNIEIKYGTLDLIKDFCSMESDTCSRTGMNERGIEYYITEMLELKNNFNIFIAYNNHIPQAGTIIFYNQNGAYYRHAVTSNDMSLGSMKYLQWFIFNYLKDHNVPYYYLYGVRLETTVQKFQGVNTFKERFGGQLDINYLYKIELNDSQQKYDIVEEEYSKWIGREDEIKRMILKK